MNLFVFITTRVGYIGSSMCPVPVMAEPLPQLLLRQPHIISGAVVSSNVTGNIRLSELRSRLELLPLMVGYEPYPYRLVVLY